MSMDNPNIFEEAIENYAEAVRRQKEAEKALARAAQEQAIACEARQAAWRKVSNYINEGKIEPGIYRLHRGTEPYADAILIQAHHDYPDLFPMFR